ncbi:unnamed protein product [Wuchereria bancrofti]|uniref:Uncharacterized protein n=1 Tax=Wuchereria bancrofti TaxID=6293 RepID=A0A3P7DBP7_WUCBA|nr:unnamed protein product [Wuchereria bancrofti]
MLITVERVVESLLFSRLEITRSPVIEQKGGTPSNDMHSTNNEITFQTYQTSPDPEEKSKTLPNQLLRLLFKNSTTAPSRIHDTFNWCHKQSKSKNQKFLPVPNLFREALAIQLIELYIL